MEVPKSGPQSVCSLQEHAFFMDKAALMGDIGLGLSSNALKSAYKRQLTSMADKLEKENVDPDVVNKMRACKVSAGMLKSLTTKATAAGLLPPNLGQRKASLISRKRVAAANPNNNEEMYNRMYKMTIELYREGKLSKPWWGNDAIFTGDESGWGSHGQANSVFSFDQKTSTQKRLFTVREGEHDEFWMSIFYGAQ